MSKDGLMPVPASNIHFIVQSLPANEEQFQEKLQALTERASFNTPAAKDTPTALQWLQQYKISQCVVAPEHFAFLLDDGRACRLRYSAHDPQDGEEAESESGSSSANKSASLSKTGDRPSKTLRTGSSSPWLISGTDLSGSGSSALRRWGTHIGVIRSIASTSGNLPGSTTTASSAPTRNRPRNGGPGADSGAAPGGVRLVRTAQLRGRGLQGSLLTGQRVIVPASHVPEELVNQVQGILQGKSRSIIIRELQRTNLDVNLAVNNLLSRDDEDNDDMEDNGGDYIPGDDLLSLLDSGIHSGEHGVFIDTDTVLPEELLGYTFHRTSRTSSSQRSGATGGDGASGGSSNRDLLQDRDPIIRLRSPRFFEPLSSELEDSSAQSSSSSAPSKKAKVSKRNIESVSLGENLEWWMVDAEFVKFSQIGAMYSELVGIDDSGTLRQWKWSKSRPYRHPSNPKVFHPRTGFLNLDDKKVTHLAACSVRASVVVENGGVATWTDETVSRHASVLEHPLSGCIAAELEMTLGSAKWKAAVGRCLHVCALYSVLFTESGDIYWWGVLPFSQRRKLLERAQAKLKRNLTTKKSSESSGKSEIKVGSLVCLHSCPMFQAGAVAIHTRGGKPKVGRLQQSAWNLSDKCSFKILRKQKRKKEKLDEKEKKTDGEKKEAKEKGRGSDVPQTKIEDTSRKEVSSIVPSNSERETVLKSTSFAPVPTLFTPVKSNKRKRTFSTSKSSQDPSSSKSKVIKEDDATVWEEMEEDTEEQWNLQDVVFIEDLQTVPVGKVLKVDGDMVAVWFSHGQKSKVTPVTADSDPAAILKNCRLLRKDDLHLLASGASPKVPECFQKCPKKVMLDPALKIHSISINEMGIKAVEGGLDGSLLTQLDISLSGKIISDCPFPSPPEMFFGGDTDSKDFDQNKHTKMCKLHSNSQDFPTVFQDKSLTLYPLLRNENWGFRDPRWLNLAPITALGMGVHAPPPHSVVSILKAGNSTSKSNMLVVTAMIFKTYTLMPMIVGRDLKNVKDFLDTLPHSSLESICEETCDGQRNILHVAVAMTAPSTNRNQEEEEDAGKDKGDKPRYKTIPPSTTTAPSTQSGAPESRSISSTRASPSVSSGGASVPRSSSGGYLMTRSERVDAVNAIANAISVVTRGGASGNSADSRRSSSGDGSAPRESRHSSAAADPFILPITYPPNYRQPPSGAQGASSGGFSSRFMRDIMQQFAAVLDDRPSSNQPASTQRSATTATSSTTTSAPSTATGMRRVPSIIRETPPSMLEGASETFPPSSRDSPTPAIPTLSWPPDPLALGSIPPVPQREEGLNLSVSDTSSGTSNRYSSKTPAKKPKRKRSLTPPAKETNPAKSATKRGTVADSLAILKTLCSSDILQPVMLKLLSQKDALGHTPFMSAVYHHAYPAALKIFWQAQAIARKRCEKQDREKDASDSKTTMKYNCDNPKFKEVFMAMIYPNGSDADNNPLYVVCANDTCSFTWTGAQHINQDIFECWTCGLTGTLCCCSECARVCHNGHDCKLKRTSPTAYCDCWEKCACRSLLAGDSAARVKLLENLLYQTKLVDLPNARGETMLQFLAHTVARQTVEQRQHRTRSNTTVSSRSGHATKTIVTGVGYDIPQHDLQPPTFCRSAFLLLLNDWTSIRSTVMSSSPGYMDRLCASSIADQPASDSSPLLLPEEEACMASQTGTSRLDAFTLCLLVKCNTEYLDLLLETFINQVQRTNRTTDEKQDLEVIHRFMRSVVRVFVILSIETQPGKQTGRNLSHTQPLKRAQRAFVALLPMAIKELCETATSLIDPVRMGVTRPTAPFPLLPSSTEAIQGCEAAFSRMPFPPRDQKKGKSNGSNMGRNRRPRTAPAAASFTFPGVDTLTSRPSSRGNYGRRGISRRRSQNTGSTRVNTSVGNGAGQDGPAVAGQEADAHADNDANRRAEPEDSVLAREDYPALTDDEEDTIMDGWRNREREEGGNDNQVDNQAVTIGQEGRPVNARADEGDTESIDLSQYAHLDDGEEIEIETASGSTSDNNADDTQPDDGANESQQEVVSEGDLDMEDEDEEGVGEEEVGGNEQNAHDEESDMDLTLMAGNDGGGDGDSDAGSSQSAGDDQAEDSAARRRVERSRILLLDEDGEMSDDIMDDDEDDEDQDGDEDERRTYDKDSLEDEAGTATDVDEDNDTSSQEEENVDEDGDDQEDDEEEEEEMASRSEWVEFPLERAPTRLQRSRATQAPHSMQWALGGSASTPVRPSTSSSSSRQPGPGSSSNTGNLIYIDPSSLRRGNTIGVNSSVPPSSSGGGDSNKSGNSIPGHSVATTNAQLARAFGICVREMAGLFAMVWQGEHIGTTPLSTFIELTYKDLEELKDFVEERMSPTWKWLLTVIDSTEAQLRYGQVLSLAGSPDHMDHPFYKGPGKNQGHTAAGKNAPPDIYRRGGPSGARSTLSFLVRMAREASNDSNAARQDFLSYALSLMRAQSGEHSDYLPVMDVSSLRHMAYVLDAVIFFRRETAAVFDESANGKRKKPVVAQRSDAEYKFGLSLNLGYENTDDEEEDEEGEAASGDHNSSSIPDELYSLAVSDVLVDNIISTSWAQAQEEADPAVPYAQPQKTFFRRSDSMTFLGCSDPDPFAEPLVKALPLADKPHLLQPNVRKEELFGRPRQKLSHEEDDEFFDPDLPGMGMGQLRHRMPEKFAKLIEQRKQMQERKRIDIGVQTDTAKQTLQEVTTPLPSADSLAGEILSEMIEAQETMVTEEKTLGDGPIDDDLIEPVTMHVPVVTSNVVVKSEKQDKPKLKKSQSQKGGHFTLPSADSLLGRCRLTLELFTKVFLDDVGAEPKSILQELGGFEVRESKFRKEMEKLRNSQSLDLQLNVEREPHRLIMQTFKQLNQHYRRRTNSSISLSSMSQPMAVQRVKVVFKEEPGEGSGVARSFYTALCEAILSSKKLPPLDCILVPSSSTSSRGASGIQNSLLSRLRKRELERERERERARRGGLASPLVESSGRKVNLRSYFTVRNSRRSGPSTNSSSTRAPRSESAAKSPEISAASPPFRIRSSSARGRGSRSGEAGLWPSNKRAIGERLLPKVTAINPSWSKKITGMLLGLPVAELLILLSSERLFKAKVADAVLSLTEVDYNGEEEEEEDEHRLASREAPSTKEAGSESATGSSPQQKARMTFRSSSSKSSPSGPSRTAEDSDHDSDDGEDVSTFPLFYQPGKRGFYSPAAGPTPKGTAKTDLTKVKSAKRKRYEARLNAFRNVGRIIGLCLLQNELCPLPLNRHVLKVLLGRKVNWHDFAFFDPVMYESLRYILSEMEDESNEDLLSFLDLNFVANPLPEEGGDEVELIPGGTSITVNTGNVRDYVRRYTTYRMITCCQKYLDKMREGLYDVLPRSALEGLTAEDLRLLVNGCGRVNVHTLISYTSFNDESGKSSGSNMEKLTGFKRWFWSVVERMAHSARQELLYFWTGSPALPASEDGFQPMPTVTIRPSDDQHLPTANTCISRLYVPLYSSRQILKQKLMTAIKTKNFGFV